MIVARDVRNEDLREGDIVRIWSGTKRITKIVPYNGPLRDIVFATVDTVPGCGFSLEYGGYTEVVG